MESIQLLLDIGKSIQIPMYYSHFSMSVAGILVKQYVLKICNINSLNIPQELLILIFEFFNDGTIQPNKITESNSKSTSFKENEKRLLLLGTQYSGKSTILKALKLNGSLWRGIYDERDIKERQDMNDNEIQQHCIIIRQNCIAGILTLLKIFFTTSQNKLLEEILINKNISNILNSIELIIKYGTNQYLPSYNFYTTLDYSEIGTAIFTLWKNIPFLKQIYEQTNNLYPDNMSHFFDKIEDIMRLEYYPTPQDILYVCEKTIGVHRYTYSIDHASWNFTVTDMSGSRFDRYSWINQFDKSYHAMIYVVSLADFNKNSLSDSSINAMQESIQLFDELINGKWFPKCECIVLLNKCDLFKDLLKKGVSLSKCFSDWNGPDYEGKYDDSDNDEFDMCYQSAVQFIQNQYICCNNIPNKCVFSHVTDATDIDLVKKVFWDVQNITVRSNLKRGAIYIMFSHIFLACLSESLHFVSDVTHEFLLFLIVL
eukprot:77238_1